MNQIASGESSYREWDHAISEDDAHTVYQRCQRTEQNFGDLFTGECLFSYYLINPLKRYWRKELNYDSISSLSYFFCNNLSSFQKSFESIIVIVKITNNISPFSLDAQFFVSAVVSGQTFEDLVRRVLNVIAEQSRPHVWVPSRAQVF